MRTKSNKSTWMAMSRFSIHILNQFSNPVKSLISNCLITALRAFIPTLSIFNYVNRLYCNKIHHQKLERVIRHKNRISEQNREIRRFVT